MRVLVVKLTSMGDVLHLLPALTDLQTQHPDAVVDWMVEDSFAELPTWHATVERVIPVATRRWRRFKTANLKEFMAFLIRLRAVRYDVVIDAQGLIKSAVLARFARVNKDGLRAGYSGSSIKESPAARLYQRQIDVPREYHAIERLRRLFADVFGYSIPLSMPRYEVRLPLGKQEPVTSRSVFLFHGTTWPTKHLPEGMWVDLAQRITNDGFEVLLTWGNDVEKQRANDIAKTVAGVKILPRSNLTELARQLQSAAGAIAVDTGLGHMAAAFGLPCVSLYGATDAALTGAIGRNQSRIQSTYPCSPCLLKQCPKLTAQITEPPCYTDVQAGDGLRPETIWNTLRSQIV
jgi:heptosyltransferase-1